MVQCEVKVHGKKKGNTENKKKEKRTEKKQSIQQKHVVITMTHRGRRIPRSAPIWTRVQTTVISSIFPPSDGIPLLIPAALGRRRPATHTRAKRRVTLHMRHTCRGNKRKGKRTCKGFAGRDPAQHKTPPWQGPSQVPAWRQGRLCFDKDQLPPQCHEYAP